MCKPNVVHDEGSSSEVVCVQPDVMICEIDLLTWGCTLGYGEAKLAKTDTNFAALTNDLLRFSVMTNKAIKGSKTLSSIAFQIQGKKEGVVPVCLCNYTIHLNAYVQAFFFSRL